MKKIASIMTLLCVFASSCSKPAEEIKDPSTLMNGTTYWKCGGIESAGTSFIKLNPQSDKAEWHTSMVGSSYDPDHENAGSGKMTWDGSGHITFTDMVVYRGGDQLLMENPPLRGKPQHKVESAEIKMTWANSLSVTYRDCDYYKIGEEPKWGGTKTADFVQSDYTEYMKAVYGR